MYVLYLTDSHVGLSYELAHWGQTVQQIMQVFRKRICKLSLLEALFYSVSHQSQRFVLV